MTTVAVIPARYRSTRFPGKPLVRETGKYLIQHVYERIGQCHLIDRVVVATDDRRIVAAVESFDGSAEITSSDHPTGTSRVAEVAGRLSLGDGDVVLNVQGDEPEIDPADLARLIERLVADDTGSVATLAAHFDPTGPTSGPGSPVDPNCVKVVVDDDWQALYFSRSLVPYPRDTHGAVNCPADWLLHLGVYAFRADTLKAIADLPASASGASDIRESLEQLRWLSAGWRIAVSLASHATLGIDTPDDYAAFVQRWQKRSISDT